MQFMVERCRRITTSGILPIVTAASFRGYWSGNTSRLSNLSLSDLISERRNRFPSSGELNFSVPDAMACIERVQNPLCPKAMSTDEIDGLSMCFDTWRFNLRKLHRAARPSQCGDEVNDALLKEKTNELKLLIKQLITLIAIF